MLVLDPLVVQVAAGLAKVTFMMTAVMGAGAVLSWVERKQSAIMQDRIGANRASVLGLKLMGFIHNIADGIKGIAKEDFIPPGANKFLHTLAPFLACFTAAAAFAVLPFGGEILLPSGPVTLPLLGTIQLPATGPISLTIAPLPVGILFVFAMLSIGVYGVVLAGYVSNNKYATLGALRATAQVISYEVAAGLTIFGALLLYQTLDFREMVQWQHSHFWTVAGLKLPKWGIFTQPIGFLLFLTAAIVEMKRVPFDLPEGESEIIGYFTEYSGMKFLLFLMAEFIESFLFAWIIVLVFFGGWHLPGLELPAVGASSSFLGANLGYWQVVGLQALAFTLKVCFFCWLMMLIRWSLPRFRYDQIMHLGWKIMLPIALVNVVITALVLVLL